MAAKKPASKLYIAVIAISILLWLGLIIAGSVIMRDDNQGIEDLGRDIYNNSVEMRENEFEITPASWAFSIWFPIYAWQAVFFLYSILSIFPRFNLHRVPIACFPFHFLTNACGFGWSYASGQDMYWVGVGFIAGMPVSMIICLTISVYKLYKKNCKYFIYTYMVQNAFAIYAGWTTVATLLWLGMTMIHGSPGMEQQMTGTIMLAILMGELVIFCSLELTIWDKFLRHVWSHYVALAVAVSGSIIRNWDPKNRNSIMTVAIAGFVTCAFLVKIMKMICCSRPDEPENESVHPEKEEPHDMSDEAAKKYIEAQENAQV